MVRRFLLTSCCSPHRTPMVLRLLKHVRRYHMIFQRLFYQQYMTSYMISHSASINGETHLTEKGAVKETRGEVTAQAISSVRGRIVCQEPSNCLESFSGSFRLDAHPRVTALDVSSFIIKGTVVLLVILLLPFHQLNDFLYHQFFIS